MTQPDLYERIMNFSSSYILSTSPDNHLIYASPLLCDLFGINKEQMIGKIWEETGLSDNLIELIAANLKIVKENRTTTLVELGPEYLGGYSTYECNIIPVFNEKGDIEFLNSIFRDITSRENLVKASHFIDRMLDILQKSNDIDNVIPQVLKDISSAFDMDIITLLFRQDEYWYPKYSFGVDGLPKDNIYLEEQPALAQMFQRSKNVLIFNDLNSDSHFAKSMAERWGVHFMIAVSLHIQGEAFAILTLASRSPVPQFSGYNIGLVKKVGGVLSLAFSEDRYIWSREGETTPSKKYLDQMNIGAAMLDAKDGSVIWSNDTYNSVVPNKYRGSAIMTMPYYHISSEIQDMPTEKIYEYITTSGGGVSYGCIQDRDKKGVMRYWQVSFIPMATKGRFLRNLCLITDVTDWENTNKKNARLIYAMLEEQYRVRTLLDSVPVGVYISDAEGHILEISRMGQKIWGNRPLPRNIEEYGDYKGTWPDTGEKLMVDDWPIAKAVRKGETTIGEIIDYVSFEDKPGTIINSAAPIKNRHGVVIGAVEIDQDITEIRTLERNLEATKAYLEAIINQMPVGVAIAEKESGKISYCNNELRKAMPAHAEIPTCIEEYTNFGMLDVDHMRPLAANEYPLARALQDNETVNNFQTIARKRNGDLITVLSSASPVRGKNGKVEGAVTILTDITHQKEIEQKLEKQTMDLVKFNSDMQRFAYVTSSELRESLKSITDYLKLIDKTSS
jgi:PAS domain S-box-containing protein